MEINHGNESLQMVDSCSFLGNTIYLVM